MKAKQEYLDALDGMQEVYYNFDGCMSAMNILEKQEVIK